MLNADGSQREWPQLQYSNDIIQSNKQNVSQCVEMEVTDRHPQVQKFLSRTVIQTTKKCTTLALQCVYNIHLIDDLWH